MSHSLIYVTASDRPAALALGKALVTERLAACANILERVTSVYWWEGQVQEGEEAVLIAKTRSELVPAAIERLRVLHPYDCPCIIALPMSGGVPGFLDWIDKETT